MWCGRRDLVCVVLFASFNILSLAILMFSESSVSRAVHSDPDLSRSVSGYVMADESNGACPPSLPRDGGEVEPLITLFTTMKDLEYRRRIHFNTMRNWASLSPWVQPVLFVDNLRMHMENNSSWGHMAQSIGWTVLQYTRSRNGVPVFKTMFTDLTELGFATTPFIGYANADILFDYNLVRSLQAVLKVFLDTPYRIMFISGRRKNVEEDVISNIEGAFCPEHVTNLAKDVPLYVEKSADYFIFSKAGFHWEKVPDFVVGRIGYDTWLLGMANNWRTTFIDASQTLNAVHQTGQDGITAGEDINTDSLINREMFPLDISIGPGKHKCAPWESSIIDNVTVIRKRTSLPAKCSPKTVP